MLWKMQLDEKFITNVTMNVNENASVLVEHWSNYCTYSSIKTSNIKKVNNQKISVNNILHSEQFFRNL